VKFYTITVVQEVDRFGDGSENDVGCNIAYWKDNVGAHSREFDSPALL
jgi:hypothetical protein